MGEWIVLSRGGRGTDDDAKDASKAEELLHFGRSGLNSV